MALSLRNKTKPMIVAQCCTFLLQNNIYAVFTIVFNQDAPVRMRQPRSYWLLVKKKSMKGIFSIQSSSHGDFFLQNIDVTFSFPPWPMIPINFLVNSQFWNFLMKPRPELCEWNIWGIRWLDCLRINSWRGKQKMRWKLKKKEIDLQRLPFICCCTPLFICSTLAIYWAIIGNSVLQGF